MKYVILLSFLALGLNSYCQESKLNNSLDHNQDEKVYNELNEMKTDHYRKLEEVYSKEISKKERESIKKMQTDFIKLWDRKVLSLSAKYNLDKNTILSKYAELEKQKNKQKHEAH